MILISIYLTPLLRLIRGLGHQFHSYADDTQLYLHVVGPGLNIALIEWGLIHIQECIIVSRLQVNSSKTEVL